MAPKIHKKIHSKIHLGILSGKNPLEFLQTPFLEALLLTVGAVLLAVELLCLQSVEVLLRHTFPL